jgi:hypothetical protein
MPLTLPQLPSLKNRQPLDRERDLEMDRERKKGGETIEGDLRKALLDWTGRAI